MLTSYNNFFFNSLNSSVRFFSLISSICYNNVIVRVGFLPTYYVRNENIWVDGFLFDFLQKKTADSWVRQYVIFTGFLFSERLVFEAVIRLYLDVLIWPAHNLNIFESSNTSSMLNITIFLYFSIFILITSSITLLI